MQLATGNFFENLDEGFGAGQPNVAPEVLDISEDSNPQIPQQREPDRDVVMSDKGNKESEGKPKASSTSKTSSSSTSRFATLDSLKNKSDSENSDEEQGQAFYAGGSTHSGQQVLGPSKRRDPDEIVSEMFKAAKEHGAEVVDPSEEAKKKKKFPAFKGTGYRLGSDDNDTQVVNPNHPTEQSSRVEMCLKLWKNGFSVDDGPLRGYNDPENQEFLQSIHAGEIPRELLQQARGAEVHVNMENHNHEEYAAPKTKVQAFVGEGHRLGSPAPDVNVAAVEQGDPKKNEEIAKKALSVDESQPATNIQIRLADGTR